MDGGGSQKISPLVTVQNSGSVLTFRVSFALRLLVQEPRAPAQQSKSPRPNPRYPIMGLPLKDARRCNLDIGTYVSASAVILIASLINF